MSLTQTRLAEIDALLVRYETNPHQPASSDLLEAAKELRMALRTTVVASAFSTGLDAQGRSRPVLIVTAADGQEVTAFPPEFSPVGRNVTIGFHHTPIGEPLTGDDTRQMVLPPNPHPEEFLPVADPAAGPTEEPTLVRGLNGAEYGAGTHFLFVAPPFGDPNKEGADMGDSVPSSLPVH